MVWLERLWQDVRYGCRTLAGSPGFAAIAVLSLAIGIGANCAIFSFADALLLRRLPVARPGDVLTVGSTTSVEAFGASSLVSSYRDYVDIRDRSTVAALGLMGLGLAIVGLFGLVAYGVSGRTREIGIRMAIGADRAAVLRMVLRQAIVLAFVGLVVGLAASVAAGEVLRAAFPSGNDERDVAALFMVIPVVLAVTFLAAYVPARRASRVNPMQALRYE